MAARSLDQNLVVSSCKHDTSRNGQIGIGEAEKEGGKSINGGNCVFLLAILRAVSHGYSNTGQIVGIVSGSIIIDSVPYLHQ